MATSFRVAEEQAQYLIELSHTLGVSQSEVLRRGLELLAAQHLGVGRNAYELGAGLFGGKATVADAGLSHNVSARLRKRVRERA